MTNPEKSNQSVATVSAYMNREVKTIPVTATLQEVTGLVGRLERNSRLMEEFLPEPWQITSMR